MPIARVGGGTPYRRVLLLRDEVALVLALCGAKSGRLSGEDTKLVQPARLPLRSLVNHRHVLSLEVRHVSKRTVGSMQINEEA